MGEGTVGKSHRWWEAVVRVGARDAELVADLLAVAGAAGVAIEPAIEVSDDADFAYSELTDELWTVRGTFAAPFGLEEQAAVQTLFEDAELAEPPVSLAFREAPMVDWAEEWKQFYHLQHIGVRLVVRPSWESYEPAAGEVVVQLDPGAAFGTGEHETTRLCLAAAERYVAAGSRVLDVGSGSGILAIAARLLGGGEVRAVDLDADTIEVARENARRNGVEEDIRLAAGSLGADWPWPDARPSEDGGYDLVLANISSTVVVQLASELAAAAPAGGLVVVSGFIVRDFDEVRGALVREGLAEVERMTEGNWGCLVLRRG